MNVDNIRLAVGYRGGRVDQNIIGKDELALLFSEIDRLEVALAGTEKMWREEKQRADRDRRFTMTDEERRAFDLRLLRGAERLRWMGWGFLAGVALAWMW